MVNVFFLVSEEVITDIIESVGGQFMLTVHVNEHIELNSAFDIDFFYLYVSHDLWLYVIFLDSG